MVAREPREQARDGELRERPQQREVREVARHVRPHVVAERLLERVALAPLVVHFAAVGLERGRGRRTLVGEHDRVVAVQDRRHDQDRGVDRGDGNVAVVRAGAVEVEQPGRERAPHVEARERGARRAMRDQLRAADPADGHGLVHRAQQLDRHERILAAADRHQAAPCEAGLRRRAARRRRVREADAPAQVELVLVRELAEPVLVDLLEQQRGRRVDRIAVDRDALRHAGLVVAHARDQVQQAQRRLQRLQALGRDGRRIGERDALHQLHAIVERIGELGHAVGVARAHEAERRRFLRIDHRVAPAE